MTEAIQKAYIKVLNRLYSLYFSEMNDKAREAYIRCIFMLLAASFMLTYSDRMFGIATYTHTVRNTIAGVLLILAAMFSMNGEVGQVRWRKCIVIPYYLSAAGLIITGIIHRIGDGYFSFGIMMIFVYPLLYLVWNNRKDYETFFDMIANANEIIGAAAFAFWIIKMPAEMVNYFSSGKRFNGGFDNSNLFSMVGMTLACASIYLLYREGSDKNKGLMHLICTLMGLIIVILGQSRASFGVVLGAGAAAAWFYLKNRTGKINRKNIAVLAIIVVLITILGGIMISVAVNYNEDDADALNKGILNRFVVEDAKDRDLNDYLSGRLTIWKSYASRLNMLGNDFSETDWEEMTGYSVLHAHNNFLEYGYRCGIPVALFFTALELFAGIITLVYLFSGKWSRDCYLFAIIFMCMYVLESIVDIATIPMERQAPFFFYIILCVLIDTDSNKRGPAEGKDNPRKTNEQ